MRETGGFSLTSKAGVFSADIAELGLFDGSVLGHVEADLAREPPGASARLTAERFDTALILGAVSDTPWLAGRADARLELEATGHGGKQLLERRKRMPASASPMAAAFRSIFPISPRCACARRERMERLGMTPTAF